jgi:septum formation inhibitor-activating ATPase MinD
MSRISQRRVQGYFAAGLRVGTTTAQGKALESLICYLFSTIPGIEELTPNVMNVFETEEVDVSFWNNQLKNGLHFLPTVVLAECKNWNHAVGSQEVSYFASRLRHRGCDYGVLVAANGITGDPADLTNAHYQMATALAEGQRILVLTKDEIEALTHSDQFVGLLKKKICALVVSGTSL